MAGLIVVCKDDPELAELLWRHAGLEPPAGVGGIVLTPPLDPLDGPSVARRLLRQMAGELIRGLPDAVLVVGRDVQRAFGLRADFLVWEALYGRQWACVPHPGPRNIWWNTQDHRDNAALFLRRAIRERVYARTGISGGAHARR
jgi:hypothetical protein